MMRIMRDTLQRERFYTSPGNRIHEILTPSFLPDGSFSLQPSDKIDIQAEINSHRSECDLSLILSRLEAGDSSMLRTGIHYGDFTQIPKSLPEMYDLVSRAEGAFQKLDPDTRHKFDDDPGKWFSQAGTKKWFEAMKSYFPEPNQSGSSADPKPMKEETA